jgi:hypothetical protein
VPTGGKPLEHDLRARMQHAMGHDFSRVRVHTDAGAAALTRSLGAAAVTQGPDIAFAPGHYRPASREGLSLLAHELAQVDMAVIESELTEAAARGVAAILIKQHDVRQAAWGAPWR